MKMAVDASVGEWFSEVLYMISQLLFFVSRYFLIRPNGATKINSQTQIPRTTQCFSDSISFLSHPFKFESHMFLMGVTSV